MKPMTPKQHEKMMREMDQMKKKPAKPMPKKPMKKG